MHPALITENKQTNVSTAVLGRIMLARRVETQLLFKDKSVWMRGGTCRICHVCDFPLLTRHV